MAACWRCGSTTPGGAKFCPECGAELRSDVADLDVFTPAPSGPDHHVEATDSTPSRWLLLVGLAILGGLVAFFAVIGGDDEPSADPFEDRADFDAVDEADGGDDEPDDEPETATTTETDEPTTTSDGEIVARLDWETTLTGGTGFPNATIEIGDDTFLYTVDGPAAWSFGGQVRAYQRVPGESWTDLGVIIDPDARVVSVWPAPDGALAVGLDATDAPTLWRSTDGTTWTAEALPPVTDPGFEGAVPRVAAEADGTIVVVGSMPDPWALVSNALQERYPSAGHTMHADFGYEGETFITLRGPFGIHIGEVEPAELGLVPDALDRFYGDFQPAPVWSNTGAGWTYEIEADPLYGVFAVGDRIFGASGYEGPMLTEFADGEWRQRRYFENVWQIQPWGDGFVGANYSQGVTVFDAEARKTDEWATPGSSVNSHISAIGAAAAGVVVAESTWNSTDEPVEPERFLVLRDGYTLEASSGELELLRDGESILRSSLFWQGQIATPSCSTSRHLR